MLLRPLLVIFCLLLASAASIQSATAKGLKVKISKKGVEIGPVKIPPPPPVVIAKGLADGKKPEDIARDVVNTHKEQIKALTDVPALQNVIENIAIQQIARFAGNDFADVVEIINMPHQILREVPAVAYAVIDRISKGESIEIIDGVPLAAALKQAKQTYEHRAKPLPLAVKWALATTFDAKVLNKARYVVDNFGGTLPAVLNRLYETIGDVHAVVVDDIIVFSELPSADNAFFWGHEVKHVEQYDTWGIEEFASRYIKDWKSIEAAADEAGKKAQADAANVVTVLNRIAALGPETKEN